TSLRSSWLPNATLQSPWCQAWVGCSVRHDSARLAPIVRTIAKENSMRHGMVVRVAGIVAVLAVGILIGRSVLASGGAVAGLNVRSAGGVEAVKVVGSRSAIGTQNTSPFDITSALFSIPAN